MGEHRLIISVIKAWCALSPTPFVAFTLLSAVSAQTGCRPCLPSPISFCRNCPGAHRGTCSFLLGVLYCHICLMRPGGGGGLASGWRWAASGGAAEVRFKLETYWLAAHSFIHLVYVYPASSQPFQQPQETAKSLGHYVTLNLSACSFILRSNSSCSSAGDWKPELFPPSKCFHLAWVNTQMARENFHTFQSASKSVSCV